MSGGHSDGGGTRGRPMYDRTPPAMYLCKRRSHRHMFGMAERFVQVTTDVALRPRRVESCKVKKKMSQREFFAMPNSDRCWPTTLKVGSVWRLCSVGGGGHRAHHPKTHIRATSQLLARQATRSMHLRAALDKALCNTPGASDAPRGQLKRWHNANV